MTSPKSTRRTFLKLSAAALAFPTLIPSRAFGANERIHVAAIGAGGKGEVDIDGAAAAGGTIAFLCDVDATRAETMFKKYPGAKQYKDFREMLEKEQKSIDAAILLNRTSDQNLIAPKQIETALGYGIHHAFTSDYRTVSTALNSGVPLALVNHSELASQFNSFTRQLLGQQEEEREPEKRRAFLGLL